MLHMCALSWRYACVSCGIQPQLSCMHCHCRLLGLLSLIQCTSDALRELKALQWDIPMLSLSNLSWCGQVPQGPLRL